MAIDNSLKQLRIIAWVEGISYIVLLFIAMPLKYLADKPAMVQYVGMAHGVLFVLFVMKTWRAKTELGWSLGRYAKVAATSLVPFGMIVFDRMMIGEGSKGPRVQGA